ncbi:hypothetical protein [Actinoalloteichus caeruleus]|uniref:hypothetical protein n=1 Tax=Actinoalloteichus TaxID=65496 RepID=UPI0035591E4E
MATVLYLLAAIGVISVAVLLWRAFAPERVGAAPRPETAKAPDDDPEFLRRLAERQWEERRRQQRRSERSDPDNENPSGS